MAEGDKGKLCILCGKLPQGDFGHIVVAWVREGRGFEMVHDLHPDLTFLDSNEAYESYMFFEAESNE